MQPAVVIPIPVSTLALAKVETGVPDKMTCPSSPDTTPESVTVPLTVAAVVPSYSLVPPLKPLIKIGLGVMSPTNCGRTNV